VKSYLQTNATKLKNKSFGDQVTFSLFAFENGFIFSFRDLILSSMKVMMATVSAVQYNASLLRVSQGRAETDNEVISGMASNK